MFQSKNLCTDYPELSYYINFCEYSLAEILLVTVGTVFWIIVYTVIIKNSIKNKYVEMPAPAAAANLAWEFCWVYLFDTDLGYGFVWGLRAWFFIDIVIVYFVYKYGKKQFQIPEIKKYYYHIITLLMIFWTIGFYLFMEEGYDTSIGANSAYIITVIMAFLFIFFFLSSDYQEGFSFTVAWGKMFANGCMSIFVWLHNPDLHFIHFLALIVFILNLIYTILVWKKKKERELQLQAVPNAIN